MIKIGDIVFEENSNITGIVLSIYDNWDDLKSKEEFPTFDPDNESQNMSDIDKIINGDPKDKWLEVQEIKFTKDNLNEKWYLILCFFGEYLWSCDSFIKKFDVHMN